MSKKNKGGRPTKYKPEYCQEIIEYYQSFIRDVKEGKVLAPKLPTLSKFALEIGVNESTIHEWADRNPEFSKSLRVCNAIQRDNLLDYGLSGEYNPTIAKLVLSANHGMVEKSATEHSGSVGLRQILEEIDGTTTDI